MSKLRLAIQVTRSQLHIGTGESLGSIDRPVSRQIVTRHPNLPPSALKRALKDAMAPGEAAPGDAPLTDAEHRALFGAARPESQATGADAQAAAPQGATGMLAPQEGHLLLLPVACMAGGGAWATSPAVWQRLCRSAALAGVPVPALPAWPGDGSACCQAAGSPLLTPVQAGRDAAQWVVLASVPLVHQPPADVAAWTEWAEWVVTAAFANDDPAWRDLVRQRLVIVSDAVLDGLLPLCLVDRARNSVGDTVNLWREEAVPQDTVFHALVGATPVPAHAPTLAGPQQALERLGKWLGTKRALLQIGGNASLGQGLMEWGLVEPLAAEVGEATGADGQAGHA